jgi:hypothetical protein
VCGILDDRDAERPQRLEVGGLAGQMNRNDRLGSRRHETRDVIRIDVQVALAHVGEHRRRARVHHDVRRRGPRDRRRDHLVAGPDAQREEREMQRGRPRGDGEDMRGLQVLGEACLELGRARAGGEPARPERFGDRLDLLVPDGRRLKSERPGATCGRSLLHGSEA